MSVTKNILVPTDFSDHSQAAIDYACELAKQAGAALHIVHVTSDRSPDSEVVAEARRQLESIGGQIDTVEQLGKSARRELIVGDPHHAILNYVRENEVDLVVMGTHGRTGLAHFVVGSVAERVIRNAPCPVLVLGPQEQNRRPSLERAVEVICESRGNEFEASRQDGLETIQTLLEAKLNVPAKTSRQLVELLEQEDWLVWEAGDPGKWSVVEAIELVEGEGEVWPSPQQLSQAGELISRARQMRATDIHIDPAEASEYLVRLRIDGKLQELCRLDEHIGGSLINQLKTMSDINIAEPFVAKESRVNLPSELADLEVRITTAPVAAGEALALRIFARDNIFLPLHNLGLSDNSLDSVHEMLRLGEGLVLVTGPTGSGKTTTLYSMLASLGGLERNVVSIEDPVELPVPFVRQMNVDPRHGITMTGGLRTLLRMDPDVVFLGEIRDPEAAQISMKAANSGRYVLTTLHTRDVASTVTALRDMEISDRSIAGNLTGIINQRLIRRLCPECKKPKTPAADEEKVFRDVGITAPGEIFTPVGCTTCRQTGYRGRIGVFEVALCRHEFETAVAAGQTEQELKELLRNRGVVSLRTDAFTKAASGITSMEEAMSVHWLQ